MVSPIICQVFFDSACPFSPRIMKQTIWQVCSAVPPQQSSALSPAHEGGCFQWKKQLKSQIFYSRCVGAQTRARRLNMADTDQETQCLSANVAPVGFYPYRHYQLFCHLWWHRFTVALNYNEFFVGHLVAAEPAVNPAMIYHLIDWTWCTLLPIYTSSSHVSTHLMIGSWGWEVLHFI